MTKTIYTREKQRVLFTIGLMNHFDRAVRVTVENYHPKGRKKSNEQHSLKLQTVVILVYWI